MENKNNFMGIIIPVVIAVILLSVLPILINPSSSDIISSNDISSDVISSDDISSDDISSEPISSEPKLFEVGDVLPATTQLRISWDYDTVTDTNKAYIKTSTEAIGYAPLYISLSATSGVYSTGIRWDNIWRVSDNTGKTGSKIIDTSSANENARTVTAVFTEGVIVTWEDLNAE